MHPLFAKRLLQLTEDTKRMQQTTEIVTAVEMSQEEFEELQNHLSQLTSTTPLLCEVEEITPAAPIVTH